MNRLRATTITFIAYVLLIVAIFLHALFVAALALGSDLAALAGSATLLVLGASVAGFMMGAKKLEEARAAVGVTDKPSIFADPLSAEEVERYLETRRGTTEATVTRLHDRDVTPLRDRDVTSVPAAA